MVLVSTLVLFVTMFAVAAGIGGGGLLVPIYAYVLGLGPQLAVPVSKATIFGVAVGNVFYISREKHPKANRPLIDYPTAVLMQGGELLGRPWAAAPDPGSAGKKKAVFATRANQAIQVILPPRTAALPKNTY